MARNFFVKNLIAKALSLSFGLFDSGRLHPSRERALRAHQRSVDYLESHMSEAIGLETPKEALENALAEVKVSGHYLEFGVYKGGTIRHISRWLRHAGVASPSIHGFDSFEGLPEAWSGADFPRSTFSLSGRLPRVPFDVILHKGWFKDTIRPWNQTTTGPIAFVHVDCDLYSSTRDALAGIISRLQPGTVVLFDEYFNYPNWENHEFKAWKEFVTAHNIAYEYLLYARFQVAVRITRIDPVNEA